MGNKKTMKRSKKLSKENGIATAASTTEAVLVGSAIADTTGGAGIIPAGSASTTVASSKNYQISGISLKRSCSSFSESASSRNSARKSLPRKASEVHPPEQKGCKCPASSSDAGPAQIKASTSPPTSPSEAGPTKFSPAPDTNSIVEALLTAFALPTSAAWTPGEDAWLLDHITSAYKSHIAWAKVTQAYKLRHGRSRTRQSIESRWGRIKRKMAPMPGEAAWTKELDEWILSHVPRQRRNDWAALATDNRTAKGVKMRWEKIQMWDRLAGEELNSNWTRDEEEWMMKRGELEGGWVEVAIDFHETFGIRRGLRKFVVQQATIKAAAARLLLSKAARVDGESSIAGAESAKEHGQMPPSG